MITSLYNAFLAAAAISTFRQRFAVGFAAGLCVVSAARGQAPAAPTNFTANATSHTAGGMAWTNPQSNTFDGVQIRYRINNGTVSTLQTIPNVNTSSGTWMTSQMSATPPANSFVTLWVRAYKTVSGISYYSDVSNPVTVAILPVPTVTVSSVSNTPYCLNMYQHELTINWVVPINSNMTGFEVLTGRIFDGVPETIYISNRTLRSLRLTDVAGTGDYAPLTNMQIRMRCINGADSSGYSVVRNVTFNPMLGLINPPCSVPASCMVGDNNNDGSITPIDARNFESSFYSFDETTDINRDGQVDESDLFEYQLKVTPCMTPARGSPTCNFLSPLPYTGSYQLNTVFNPGQTAWYQVGNNAAGPVTITSQALTPGYSAALTVYRGTDCSSLESNRIAGPSANITFDADVSARYVVKCVTSSPPPYTFGSHVAIEIDSIAYCRSDFNQDGGVDGSDIAEFFAHWSDALSRADINEDGGIDGSDVDAFFELWTSASC